MAIQSLVAVKRGNTTTETTMNWSHPGSRTRNQHEGVLAHFRRHPAAWICGNPFGSDRPGQKYKCGFSVTYYNRDGCQCGFWVRPDGRVEDYSICAPGSMVMVAEARVIEAEYGLFRGGE